MGRSCSIHRPLGNYTLNLQDPAGPGLAKRSGTVAADGVLGDILLDEAPPAVASTVPPASGVAVPLNQVVRIVFTEPILPGTVTAENVVLEGPSGPVTYALNVTDGDTVATLTPIAPLKDETRYSVRVEHVKDRVGKEMAARFTSTFTTVDITAPAFASVSPASNGSGVAIVSPVRIQFSEPIDPARFRAPPFTLSGPQGAVAGRLDFILGNTALVFTPNLPLAEATTYRVQMSAAVDAAGNTQSQDLDYTFTTTDRTPPQILGLARREQRHRHRKHLDQRHRQSRRLARRRSGRLVHQRRLCVRRADLAVRLQLHRGSRSRWTRQRRSRCRRLRRIHPAIEERRPSVPRSR